jgi:F-type H+-transporting ATPase subunit a
MISHRRLLAAVAAPALLLAAPVAAGAAEGGEFKPQNEFKLDPWIPIEVFGIDLSINKLVLYLVLAALATCGTMLYIANRMQARPNRVQTAVEAAYDLTSNTITRGNMDARMSRKWFAFIATLFFFIWFSNMIGYIPLPTGTEHPVNVFGLEIPAFVLYAATANLSTPLALALVVWLAYHIEGIRAKGFVRYVKGWVPAGVSGPVIFLVAPIEVISQFVRLISLSARLFANMLAGHMLILVMAGGMAVLLGSALVGIFTLPVALAFYIFEVGLVASLQAFIFALLSAIYLGEAVAEEH